MSWPNSDVARARAQTPGCAHVTHFNNAGAALMPEPVVAAQIDHVQLEARVGGYEAAAIASQAVDNTYAAVARLLAAQPSEVAVFENATAAWCAAFYAIAFRPGDRILTARAEYASNYLAYLQVVRRTGAVVDVIPCDETGQVSVSALADMIDSKVKLISISHVPTNGGLVNPAAEIGRIARSAGALFLVDACQSAGQLPVDVGELGCDFLSATSRKYLRGPRGCGFLYVRRDSLERFEPATVDLLSAEWTAADRFEWRPDARRFETWESNLAAKIGMGVAIDYALSWGLARIEARVVELAGVLRRRLSAIPGVVVRDLGARKCGITTFTCAAVDAATVQRRLRAQSINVSVSAPSSTLLDAQARGLPPLVRASVHYYNDYSDIERLCEALEEIVRTPS